MKFENIIGYEDMYQISINGDVINKKKNTMIKPSVDSRGYYQVHFSKNGKPKKISLHRLLAIQFIPNPLNKTQVNHIDGNKKNNAIDNLEWCTPSENIRHAWDTGLCKMTEKNRETARKLKSKMVLDLQTGIFFDSVLELTKALNVSYSMANVHANQKVKNPRFIYV
jgi:hypothetical protein